MLLIASEPLSNGSFEVSHDMENGHNNVSKMISLGSCGRAAGNQIFVRLFVPECNVVLSLEKRGRHAEVEKNENVERDGK